MLGQHTNFKHEHTRVQKSENVIKIHIIKSDTTFKNLRINLRIGCSKISHKIDTHLISHSSRAHKILLPKCLQANNRIKLDPIIILSGWSNEVRRGKELAKDCKYLMHLII